MNVVAEERSVDQRRCSSAKRDPNLGLKPARTHSKSYCRLHCTLQCFRNCGSIQIAATCSDQAGRERPSFKVGCGVGSCCAGLSCQRVSVGWKLSTQGRCLRQLVRISLCRKRTRELRQRPLPLQPLLLSKPCRSAAPAALQTRRKPVRDASWSSIVRRPAR